MAWVDPARLRQWVELSIVTPKGRFKCESFEESRSLPFPG